MKILSFVTKFYLSPNADAFAYFAVSNLTWTPRLLVPVLSLIDSLPPDAVLGPCMLSIAI